MNLIINSQKKIIEKLKKINHENFNYFCSFNYSIGYGLLKYLKNRNNFFFIFKYFFKELFGIFFMNDYELIQNKNYHYLFKKIIFTWGNQSNIDKQVYIDNYFKKKSTEDLNILWVVLYRGQYDKKKLTEFKNVCFIVEKNKNFYSKFFFFFKVIFKFFNIKKKNLYNFFFYFSWHNIFSQKLKILYKNFLHKDLETLLIPYEGQPFQSVLIKMAKDISIKSFIVGYVHSYPSFPTHLLRKINFPDRLIVSSEDQFQFFFENVTSKNNLKIIESLRFKKKPKETMLNKIYLPIDFFSKKKILNSFEFLINKYLKNHNLSLHEICNHPVAENSIKHQELIKKIKFLIENTKREKIFKQFSIFIGSTGSVLEALELGTEVLHITEDPVLEVYSNFIWKNIIVKKLSKNIFSYQLKEKNKSIIFGSNRKKIFYECLEK